MIFNILLIVINIFLILIVYFLLTNYGKNKTEKNDINEDMKSIELFEFQQNLKNMIDDFKNFSDNIIKKIDEKNEKLKKTLKEAEIKINEINYLIERINLLKKTENKIEIIKPVNEPGKENKTKDLTEKNIKNIQDTSTKFIIKEKTNDIDEKDKYEAIKNLLENGLTISEIAVITGLSKGEIELVKNLKNKK